MIIPSPNGPQRRAKPVRVVKVWCRCQRCVPAMDMALRALCLVRLLAISEPHRADSIQVMSGPADEMRE